MLRLRYEMLRDVVDVFVLVEARQTFTGQPKPLHFQEGSDQLPRDLLARTVAVSVDLPFNPSLGQGSTWDNEAYQRHATLLAVTERLQPDPRDIILHSDLDEIYRPSALKAVVRALSDGHQPHLPAETLVLRFGMTLFYYNLSCILDPNRLWTKPYGATYATLVRLSAGITGEQGTVWPGLVNYVRVNLEVHLLRDVVWLGGWHLSYFKSLRKIFEKLEAFSHSEVNTEAVRREAASRIERGLSLVHHDKDQELYCRWGRSGCVGNILATK